MQTGGTVVEDLHLGDRVIRFLSYSSVEDKVWAAYVSENIRFVVHYHPKLFPEQPYTLEFFIHTEDLTRHITLERYPQVPDYSFFRERVIWYVERLLPTDRGIGD